MKAKIDTALLLTVGELNGDEKKKLQEISKSILHHGTEREQLTWEHDKAKLDLFRPICKLVKRRLNSRLFLAPGSVSVKGYLSGGDYATAMLELRFFGCGNGLDVRLSIPARNCVEVSAGMERFISGVKLLIPLKPERRIQP